MSFQSWITFFLTVCLFQSPTLPLDVLLVFLTSQGEDVVAGLRTPEPIARLQDTLPTAFDELVANCDLLERHYQDMQVDDVSYYGIPIMQPGDHIYTPASAEPDALSCSTLYSQLVICLIKKEGNVHMRCESVVVGGHWSPSGWSNRGSGRPQSKYATYIFTWAKYGEASTRDIYLPGQKCGEGGPP